MSDERSKTLERIEKGIETRAKRAAVKLAVDARKAFTPVMDRIPKHYTEVRVALADSLSHWIRNGTGYEPSAKIVVYFSDVFADQLVARALDPKPKPKKKASK